MEAKAAVVAEILILINTQAKEVQLSHLFLHLFQLITQINIYLYFYVI